jgi:ATP/maltotriose-dependent transcriptional regulator MalT
VLNNLGAASYFEGRWDVALTYYERSKHAFLRCGSEVQAALGSMNSGEILVNQGRLDEAEPLLREAQRVLRASGSEAAQFAELQLGRLQIQRGNLDEAERLLTHAQQDAQGLGQRESALEAAIQLSRCHLLRGDAGPALTTLRAAQRTGRAEMVLYAAQVAEVESTILVQLGRLDEALAVCDLGLAEAERQGLVYELALLLLAKGDVQARAGWEVDRAAIDGANDLLRGLGCDARIDPQPAFSR